MLKPVKAFTLGLMITGASCQQYLPAQPQINAFEASKPGLKDNVKAIDSPKKQLKFKLRFDQAFQLQCSQCQVRYVQLEIKGPGYMSTPIYAYGSDANGFTPISDGENTLIANVPEGNNWVAIAGLYATNQPGQVPIQEIGGAFHMPATEAEIELSLRSLQTAQIIDSMHQIESPKLLSPLDLQKYQALSDALLGVSQNPDGTYEIGRMPALQERGTMLDSHAIAQLINSNQISENEPEAAAALPLEQILPLPEVKGGVRLRSFTAGLSKLVMNPDNGNVFSYDLVQGQRRVYGFATPQLNEVLTPYNLGELRNLHLSLGIANPTLSNPTPVKYIFENSGLDRMRVRALSQADGSQVWSFDFNNSPALFTDYVPTAWRDTSSTSDVSDDNDWVYVPLNADPFNHADKRGVYALKNGQQQWMLPINTEFNNAGAYDPDTQHLYLVSRSDPFEASKLYAVNTQTRTLSWNLDLGQQTFTSSTPVVGSNGNIYVITFTVPNNYKLGQPLPGKLQCINSQGQPQWEFELPSSSSFSPVIDQQNGEDVIYLISDMARLTAVSQSGQEKWSLVLPGTAGEGPVDAPLIAEDIGGGRTLYQAVGNGLVYAIRDRQSLGELMWAQAPGGKAAKGMVLNQGELFIPTLDGGEGQWVQIKRLSVHSLGLPANAPWPMTGGNPAGNGVGYADQLNSHD